MEDAVRLLGVVEQLSVARRLEDVIAVVRRSARTLLGADGVTFVLKDGDCCFYADEDAIAPLWKGRRFLAETCISGWSMRHKELVAIEDIYQDPRIPHDAYRPTFVRSLAMAPVRREDPVAAIGAYWRTERRPTERELALLQTLADSAAIALDNAHLNRHLEAALDRLRLAVSSADIGVWDWNPLSGELVWDARCRGLFGVSPEAPVGYETFTAALHPEDRQRTLDTIERVLAGGGEGGYRMEFRVVGIEDHVERWISAQGRAFFDGAGRAYRFIGMAVDISDLKRTHAALEQSLRSRDQFLSIAGHELRTPLTALQLQVDGLVRALDGGLRIPLDRLAVRMGKVAAHVERLGRLVNELLDVTRISAGHIVLELERVDLAELVRDVADTFSEAAEHAGSPLQLSLEGPLDGNWDRLRIEQVVSNLLGNAIKYGRGRPVAVTASADGDTAVLSVRDQGIGIDPSLRERIFERFERAASPRNYGGLGLGLWIVRQIVDASGGTIEAESSPGLGATFTVRLPRRMTRPG